MRPSHRSLAGPVRDRRIDMPCRVKLGIYLVGYARGRKKGKRGEKQRARASEQVRETEREKREERGRDRSWLFKREREKGRNSGCKQKGKSACLSKWGREWAWLVS